MKKIIILLLTVVGFNYLLADEPNQNLPDSIPTYHFSEIVIMGDRISSVKSATVHEINRKEITALDIQDVHPALQYDLNTVHQLGLLLHFIDNRFNVPPETFISRPRFWQFPE